MVIGHYTINIFQVVVILFSESDSKIIENSLSEVLIMIFS